MTKSNSKTSKTAHKMDSIDETSVLESTSSTGATVDSPCRSINTTASSSSVSMDSLHDQLRRIEEAETAYTISCPRHLQEEVLDQQRGPALPSIVFKYILICMGLCGILIGIVLGAIIGQHLLKQSQPPRDNKPTFSLDDDLANETLAPSLPPVLEWYYPPTPTPRPPSDIFDHNLHSSLPPFPVRTAHPTVTSSSTLMPTTTTNRSSIINETFPGILNPPIDDNNSTDDDGDVGQGNENRNETETILS